MNKKDIAEIKKNYSDDSGFFTLNRIIFAYIDAERNVHCKENKLFATIPGEETEVLYETLKKTLSGSLGKNLREYVFPTESYEEDGAQNVLYAAVRSKFENDEDTDRVIDRIRQNLEYETAYCIILAHCTYTIMTKDKNDDITENSDSDFHFMTAAICPMATNTDGLYYNSSDNVICKKSNTDLIISRVPTDGFMYPVYSGRSPDVNHVLYYAKAAKKPNVSLVEDVLDCTFTMTAEEEKECFRELVQQVAGEELSYAMITQMNEIIEDVAAQNKDEDEVTMIDESRLRSVLSDAGVSDEKLEALSSSYKLILGDDSKGFTAVNLIEPKTVVQAEGITVNIGKDAGDKVRMGTIQGRKCLIIDLEDPTLTINGMDTIAETEDTSSSGNNNTSAEEQPQQ